MLKCGTLIKDVRFLERSCSILVTSGSPQGGQELTSAAHFFRKEGAGNARKSMTIFVMWANVTQFPEPQFFHL